MIYLKRLLIGCGSCFECNRSVCVHIICCLMFSRCLNRMVQNWDALKVSFEKEVRQSKEDSDIKHFQGVDQSPSLRVSECLSLQALPMFRQPNLPKGNPPRQNLLRLLPRRPPLPGQVKEVICWRKSRKHFAVFEVPNKQAVCTLSLVCSFTAGACALKFPAEDPHPLQSSS